MQEFKRKHFEAAHPGTPYPRVETLSEGEATALRARIAERVKCSADDGLALVQSLAARSVLVEGIAADSDDFHLLGTLWRFRVRPQPTVFINWYRFDNVDRIDVEDLSRHFGDIWYPSSDDIDILDDTCDWILSVGHSGDVRLTHLGFRQTIGR
jgi:hypothetical protein